MRLNGTILTENYYSLYLMYAILATSIDPYWYQVATYPLMAATYSGHSSLTNPRLYIEIPGMSLPDSLSPLIHYAQAPSWPLYNCLSHH